jgi:hypothetical protein
VTGNGVKQRIELRVLSREAAERYEPRGVEVCISIGDPCGTRAKLSPTFAAVLRLTFNDIVESPAKEDILFAVERGFPSWNRLVRRLIGEAARESAQTPVRRQ